MGRRAIAPPPANFRRTGAEMAGQDREPGKSRRKEGAEGGVPVLFVLAGLIAVAVVAVLLISGAYAKVLFAVGLILAFAVILGSALNDKQLGGGGVPTVRRELRPRLPERRSAEPDELDRALASVYPSPASAPTAPPRPPAWSLEVLDRMEWKRFEDLCCEFYREKGIRAETTRLGADGGVDVRLFQDDADPARVTAIVQCKAHSRQVGVKPVRELRGVMAHQKVEKAFFMAPRGFTDEARAFAAENRITLLDGKLFLAMLQRLPAESGQRLLEFATAGDWTTPTCPTCGGRMSAREGKRGAFWGCTSYPQCRGLLPMRGAAS